MDTAVLYVLKASLKVEGSITINFSCLKVMLLCKWQYEDDRVSSEIMKKYHLCILHIGIILLLIEQLYYIRLSRFILNTERVTHFGFTRFIYIFSHTSIYIYFSMV